jgi:peptide deformylase
VAIVQAGAAVLRRPALPVDPKKAGSSELAQLIDEMWAALTEAPGVGLAAPQIGVPLRLVVIHDLQEYIERVSESRRAELERSPIAPYVLINPEIETLGEERRTFFEGCLSVEGYCALVNRARTVRVRWLDPAGEEHQEVRTGWHARILQHEVDHLDGVLYIDRMLSRSFMTTANYAEWADQPVEALLEALGGA